MKRNNCGQSIFEVLVAIAVISGVLIILVGYVSTSLKNSTFTKNTANSTHLTQEAIEWLRAQRDTNWLQFKNYASASAVYCLSSSPLTAPASWTNTGTCSAAEIIPGTIFRREVTFTCFINPPASVACSNAAVTTIQAQLTTYFTDGQGRHDARDAIYLTNWK